MKLNYHLFGRGEIPIFGKHERIKILRWVPKGSRWEPVPNRKKHQTKDLNFHVPIFEVPVEKFERTLQRALSKLDPKHQRRGMMTVCFLWSCVPYTDDPKIKYLHFGILYSATADKPNPPPGGDFRSFCKTSVSLKPAD